MDDLETMLSQMGLGGYMDNDIRGLPQTKPGLNLRYNNEINYQDDMDDMHKSILLAMLYKKYYPQTNDKVAGQWALQQMLNRGLNEGLFGKALGNAQQQMRMTY